MSSSYAARMAEIRCDAVCTAEQVEDGDDQMGVGDWDKVVKLHFYGESGAVSLENLYRVFRQRFLLEQKA